jgi:chromosome segregation ATPase
VQEKLKQIVQNYAPCFNLYGYGGFGLDEEECKFIEDNSAKSPRDYDRVNQELTKKTIEIKQLNEQIRLLEDRQQRKELDFSGDTQQRARLVEENRALKASIDSLTERMEQISQAQMSSSNREEDNPYPELSEEASQQEDLRKQQYAAQAQQTKARVAALGELAVELYEKYDAAVGIIREKDRAIAEAQAEIRVLRSECKAKVFTFETVAAQLAAPTAASFSSMQESKVEEVLQQFQEEYSKLRAQIGTMSQAYENEVVLL